MTSDFLHGRRTNTHTVEMDPGMDIRRQLGIANVIRVAQAVEDHPRAAQLFTSLDNHYAWLERAQAHYLGEIDRIGPTKVRLQLGRIVNEVTQVAA